MKRNKILLSVMLCFMLAASVFAINKKEAHAAGNYWLQVNKGTNVVTVYRSDGTPERAFVCSVGSATPIGTFYTPNKYRWHELDGPSYGQYCTRITAGYLFHSVWYYRNGDYASQSYVQYNKLGTTASHGCVRLTVADAKWIYDNCPLGTRVTVMYGSSANDPLGKPVAIKVPNVREGWDPTDPNPANPYRASQPSINTSGANTTVPFGSAFNPMAGITAKDSLGNDATGKVSYAGSVNTNSLGTYKITYRITDALGRTAYADVVYTVSDTQQATITGVAASLEKEYNSTLNLRKNVQAKNVTGTDLTSQIRIKVIYPKSSTEEDYTKSTLKLNKLGTYTINYYVSNPNNGMETKVTCKVKVRDTKKPKLSGIKTKRTYEYGTTKNLKSGVKAKLVSGKDMTSKITIKLRAPGQKSYKTLKESKYKKYKFSKTGTYKIEYSVKNPYNKKAVAKKVQTVTVKDTKKPVVTWPTLKTEVEYGTAQNLKSGLKAKLKSGKNVYSKVKITVTTPQKVSTAFTGKKYTFDQVGRYTIAYSVANPSNAKAVAKKTLKVTVKDTKAPIVTGVTDKSTENVEIDAKWNLKAGITAKLVSGTDVTANIKVNVTTPDKVTTPFPGTEYAFVKAGTYTVAYTVANPSNQQAVTTVTKNFVVADNRAPEITVNPNKLKDAVTNTLKDAQAGIPYNVYEGVAAKVGQTDIPAADIAVQIKNEAGIIVPSGILNSRSPEFTFGSEGIYKITYTVKNPNNAAKVTTKEFTLNVLPKTPSGDVTDGDGTQAQSKSGYMNPQDEAGMLQPKDASDASTEQVQPEVKDNPEEQESPEEGTVSETQDTPEEGSNPETQEVPEEGTVPETQKDPEEMTVPETQESPEEGTVPATQEGPEEGTVPATQEGPEEGTVPETQGTPEEGMDPAAADGADEEVQPEAPCPAGT